MTPVLYQIRSIAAGRRAMRSLEEAFSSRALDAVSRETTVLETFDWRIARANRMLTWVHGRPGLLLWASTAGQPQFRAPADRPPAFEWDLPEGPFRETLRGVIRMRRLLPIASIRQSIRTLEIVDDEAKTLCRVTLETGTVSGDDKPNADVRQHPGLRVTPLRGYETAFESVLEYCDTRLDLARSPGAELQRVCAAIGRHPGDVPPKQTYSIRRGTRADEAMQSIHRSLLATIRRNLPGTIADLDSEFLHDARVAIRRTRSALTQVPGVFPIDDVARFKREFRWLGGVTGPTRDMDVYLLKIPDYRDALHGRHREDLDPLVDLLRERQREAHRRMVAELESPRCGELLRVWAEFLEAPVPEASGLPDAMRPIESVASERIRRAWRKVIKRGRRIDGDSPDEQLHDLRIDCKKLRYLLEFFAGLYGKKRIKPLIAALKQLQDNLGDLNDLAVQIEALGEFEHSLEERNAPRDTLIGIEELVAHLDRQRVRERAAFAEHFAGFSARSVRDAFRSLFPKPADDAP